MASSSSTTDLYNSSDLMLDSSISTADMENSLELISSVPSPSTTSSSYKLVKLGTDEDEGFDSYRIENFIFPNRLFRVTDLAMTTATKSQKSTLWPSNSRSILANIFPFPSKTELVSPGSSANPDCESECDVTAEDEADDANATEFTRCKSLFEGSDEGILDVDSKVGNPLYDINGNLIEGKGTITTHMSAIIEYIVEEDPDLEPDAQRARRKINPCLVTLQTDYKYSCPDQSECFKYTGCLESILSEAVRRDKIDKYPEPQDKFFGSLTHIMKNLNYEIMWNGFHMKSDLPSANRFKLWKFHLEPGYLIFDIRHVQDLHVTRSPTAVELRGVEHDGKKEKKFTIKGPGAMDIQIVLPVARYSIITLKFPEYAVDPNSCYDFE